MEVSTDSGLANATVNWMVPQATDNVEIVNETASHMPGVVVDLGNNIMVEYVAVDAAGLNGTCSFNITVKGKLLLKINMGQFYFLFDLRGV